VDLEVLLDARAELAEGPIWDAAAPRWSGSTSSPAVSTGSGLTAFAGPRSSSAAGRAADAGMDSPLREIPRGIAPSDSA